MAHPVQHQPYAPGIPPQFASPEGVIRSPMMAAHGTPNAGPRFGAVPDDARSDVSFGSSNASSSAVEPLPLCPTDSECTKVNDRDHQRQYAHTCRLFPCFHAHLKYHARFFRHQPGQAAMASSEEGGSEGGTSGKTSSQGTGSVSRTRAAKQRKQARRALSSVSFTHISPDVANAQKIVVSHKSKAYEISGDWSKVRVHTFKRYLYQVTAIRPADQVVTMGQAKFDDETVTLSELGVAEGSQINVEFDASKTPVSANDAPVAPVAAATAAQPPKVPVAWL